MIECLITPEIFSVDRDVLKISGDKSAGMISAHLGSTPSIMIRAPNRSSAILRRILL